MKSGTSVKMNLKGLMVDPVSKMPVVILRDEASGRVLPIWIGVFEANAIAIALEHVKTPRPLTHDLIRNMLDVLGAQVVRVDITHMVESTYYAVILVSVNGTLLQVDSRPSDALALALRTQAPIYADEDVIERSKNINVGEDKDRHERIKKWLEGIDPEELGKYKM